MFEPNQKVVCINDTFPPDIRDYINASPVKGRTYTVRDMVGGITFGLEQTVSIYLVELVNLPNMHGIEPGFLSTRFAEVEEVECEAHTEEVQIA